MLTKKAIARKDKKSLLVLNDYDHGSELLIIERFPVPVVVKIDVDLVVHLCFPFCEGEYKSTPQELYTSTVCKCDALTDSTEKYRGTWCSEKSWLIFVGWTTVLWSPMVLLAYRASNMTPLQPNASRRNAVLHSVPSPTPNSTNMFSAFASRQSGSTWWRMARRTPSSPFWL